MSGQASSPNSSNEVASHHGTPETRLTSFTPEDSRVSGRSVTLKVDSDDGKDEYYRYIANRCMAATATSSDPFLSPSQNPACLGSHRIPRLSPTAASFTPSTLSSYAELAGAQLSPQGLMDKKEYSGVSYLVATSVPDTKAGTGFSRVQFKKPTGTTTSSPSIRPIGSGRQAPTTSQINFGSFTSDDNNTRCLVIEDINTHVSAEDVAEFFSVHQFPSLKAHVFTDLATKGNLYVAFTDVRDANLAYDKARAIPQWSTRRVSPTEFALMTKPQFAMYASGFEGQVHATLYCKFEEARAHQNTTGPNVLKGMLEKYGDVKAFRTLLQGSVTGLSEFRAEFYDCRAADNAVFSLDTAPFGDFVLAVQHHRPDQPKSKDPVMDEVTARLSQMDRATKMAANLGLDPMNAHLVEQSPLRARQYYSGFPHYDSPVSPTRGPIGSRTPAGGPHTFAHFNAASGGSLGYNPGFTSRFNAGQSSDPIQARRTRTREPYLQLSPTGRSTLPRDGDESYRTMKSSNFAAFLANERQEVKAPTTQYATYRIGREINVASPSIARTPKSGGRNGNDNGVGQHNTVDIERIRQGLDVRTTIMLRNIPNKIDQAMLKGIVDETSHGKYDFMYLRIDFANNCNVGYAFINFEDPYYIIDFVKAKAGQRWNRFNSDKVAEVSYATIQGKDCLVQKFRNSSVMLEHPSFRPKIFFTGTGPRASTEDIFPGPDNPSKMRRSVENAEHVGLFAPRAGQQFRDEQRRRRSNFDRGTRLAQVEDVMAVGEGWIEGDYWVRLPGRNNLVRVSLPPVEE